MSRTAGTIGQMKESSLHRDLKELYQRRTGGETEVLVDGYIVDLKCDDMIVEIQTGNFSRLHKKLMLLLVEHQVRVVYLWYVRNRLFCMMNRGPSSAAGALLPTGRRPLQQGSS